MKHFLLTLRAQQFRRLEEYMFEQFLAAPRVMVLENDGRRELSGLWRLPVMPEGTVKPAFAEYNK